MYLGNGPPRRRTGSNPIRVFILLVLIGAGLYILTVKPKTFTSVFAPTPTATQTAASYTATAEGYYADGDLANAISSYEEAVRRDPTIISNYIALTRLLVFESRYDEALDYANTALFVEPDNAAALAIRSMALDWKSGSLADEGLDKDAEDMFREALAQANRAVELDPSSAEAYAYLAEILFDLGSYDQADEAITNAELLNENSLDVQRIAGYLAELRGYRDLAIEHYVKAIELHPKLAMLYHALGRTYIGAGEIDKAISNIETAIALDPENSEYLYWLGYAYFTIGERDYAADYFQQAIEIRPNYPAAHCQLGLIYYQQRNWEGAIPELESGVEGYGELITYRNAFCYYTLGLSYFYIGQCEDAYPLFDRVLKAVPDNAPAEEGIRLCKEAESQVTTEEEPTTTPEN